MTFSLKNIEHLFFLYIDEQHHNELFQIMQSHLEKIDDLRIICLTVWHVDQALRDAFIASPQVKAQIAKGITTATIGMIGLLLRYFPQLCHKDSLPIIKHSPLRVNSMSDVNELTDFLDEIKNDDDFREGMRKHFTTSRTYLFPEDMDLKNPKEVKQFFKLLDPQGCARVLLDNKNELKQAMKSWSGDDILAILSFIHRYNGFHCSLNFKKDLRLMMAGHLLEF